LNAEAQRREQRNRERNEYVAKLRREHEQRIAELESALKEAALKERPSEGDESKQT